MDAKTTIIIEALKNARTELDALQDQEDWFVSDSLDSIEYALTLLENTCETL